MSLIGRQVGEMVYMDCDSSMGASSCGDVEITDITQKFDEDTGVKYDVIHTGEDRWDSRTGFPLKGTAQAFYIT